MVPISLSAPIINLLLKSSIMHMIIAKDLHDCTTTSNIDLFKLKNRASFRCRDSLFQRFLQWRTKTSIKVRALVKTQAFFWTVLTCVFLNTIVLAVEYHNQPDWLTEFQCKSDMSIGQFRILTVGLDLA